MCHAGRLRFRRKAGNELQKGVDAHGVALNPKTFANPRRGKNPDATGLPASSAGNARDQPAVVAASTAATTGIGRRSGAGAATLLAAADASKTGLGALGGLGGLGALGVLGGFGGMNYAGMGLNASTLGLGQQAQQLGLGQQAQQLGLGQQ